MVSHLLYLSSAQMRVLLGSFQQEKHRADAFVTFYLQIVDMWTASHLSADRQNLGVLLYANIGRFL